MFDLLPISGILHPG